MPTSWPYVRSFFLKSSLSVEQNFRVQAGGYRRKWHFVISSSCLSEGWGKHSNQCVRKMGSSPFNPLQAVDLKISCRITSILGLKVLAVCPEQAFSQPTVLPGGWWAASSSSIFSSRWILSSLFWGDARDCMCKAHSANELHHYIPNKVYCQRICPYRNLFF